MRDVNRAEKVFCQMVSDRMQVEPRTWQALVRASMGAGNYEQTVRLLSMVLGATGPCGKPSTYRSADSNHSLIDKQQAPHLQKSIQAVWKLHFNIKLTGWGLHSVPAGHAR
eukprot:2633291-Amphidinium_carterae.1